MENDLQATTKTKDIDHTLGVTENPKALPVDIGKELAAKVPDEPAAMDNSLGGVTELIADNEDSQHQKGNSPVGTQELDTQKASLPSEDNKQSELLDKNSLGGVTDWIADNKDSQQQKGNTPVGTKDIREASLPTKDNKQSELLIEENRKAKLKVKLEFGYSVILLGFIELLGVKLLPRDSVSEFSLATIAILGALALISGFCLQMHTLFMLAPRSANTSILPVHHIVSKGLAIICCMTLVLAFLPLSLLPMPYNLLILVVLAAVVFNLSAHLYLKSKTSQAKSEKNQTDFDEQTKEITRLSELSQVIMSLSSGGLTGLLFGIHKNSSNHAHHPFVSATVFLLFISFMFSISLMFLFQIRLVHLSSDTRKLFLRIGEGFCKFLLVLLAFAAVIIAFKFLKVNTVMVCVPLIAYFLWKFIGLPRVDSYNIQDLLLEEHFKLAYTKGNKIASVSFAGIMAVFSGYLGSEENMHLKYCMAFMVSAFLSGLCLMLLSYKPSSRSNLVLFINILSYFAMNMLAFGALTIFILEFV